MALATIARISVGFDVAKPPIKPPVASLPRLTIKDKPFSMRCSTLLNIFITSISKTLTVGIASTPANNRPRLVAKSAGSVATKPCRPINSIAPTAVTEKIRPHLDIVSHVFMTKVFMLEAIPSRDSVTDVRLNSKSSINEKVKNSERLAFIDAYLPSSLLVKMSTLLKSNESSIPSFRVSVAFFTSFFSKSLEIENAEIPANAVIKSVFMDKTADSTEKIEPRNVYTAAVAATHKAVMDKVLKFSFAKFTNCLIYCKGFFSN